MRIFDARRATHGAQRDAERDFRGRDYEKAATRLLRAIARHSMSRR
jgi:hypothetical protein